MVPHDMFGLMELHGSAEVMASRLSTFFEEEHYTHVNEPDIHAMYLFLVTGRPELTQRWVDYEDAGTLSAWYVLSAIGQGGTLTIEAPDAGVGRPYVQSVDFGHF